MTPKWEQGMDEYLETMGRLAEHGRKTNVTAIAAELGVAKASTSQMLRKMAKTGLVSFPKYGEPELTEKGRTAANAILRKHRVLHGFLELIGVRKSKIHAGACELEHAISDDIEKQIEKVVRRHETIRLEQLKLGVKGSIVKIKTDPKTAQRLGDMGLTEGAEITITQSAPFKGPLELSVRGTRLAIGRKLALKIYVKGMK